MPAGLIGMTVFFFMNNKSTNLYLLQGDSGGPFVCKDRLGIWYQVAMAELFEYGRNNEECTNSLLTKVDHHLDFIYKGKSSRCNYKFIVLQIKSIICDPFIVLENQDKFNKTDRVFQTFIGIIPFLIMSLHLSVAQNVFHCQ